MKVADLVEILKSVPDDFEVEVYGGNPFSCEECVDGPRLGYGAPAVTALHHRGTIFIGADLK